MPSDTNRLASRGIETATGQKFCYQCRNWRGIDGGMVLRDARGCKRWCCARCGAKRKAAGK